MSQFSAFRIRSEHERVSGSLVTLSVDDLSPGDVVVRAAYSSVNYKDALAATGAGKILKRFPLVGGIDVAGTVVSSSDARFVSGQEVLITGYDLGVGHDGGYAGVVRVPGDWVVPLPEGLSLFESMVYGTAGFTAALAVVRLERMGLAVGHGPVAVTGATGGVGSVATAVLARLGYEVVAVTGKAEQHGYLRGLGASNVLDRTRLELGSRPLEKAQWAAAVDAVGGDLLAWLVRSTLPWGAVASTGLTGGTHINLTVMPFILRGVSLVGVDSVACPMALRLHTWQRMAGDMKPDGLTSLAETISLDQLPTAFETLLAGQARGRFVVAL